MTALFPGSFDPVTLGHAELIARASAIFDRLIVAVMNNANKKTLFTIDERVKFLSKTAGSRANVEVREYSGLLSDYFFISGADVIVRGVRSCAEFERELTYARAYASLDKRIETLFIPPSPERCFISSSMAREAAACGGNLHLLLPDVIIDDVNEKFFAGGL